MDEVNDLQASTQQKRLFFALCNQLGWDSDGAKDRVKKKYHLDSFANVSKEQLTEVIDIMTARADNKTETALVEFFKMHMNFKEEEEALTAFAKDKLPEEYKKENFPQHLTTELMKYFAVRQKQYNMIQYTVIKGE